MPSVEQDFVSFRDRGDLPALAAVFDALAPHLLLVAGHLVRDGALAEDLVQTTFVEAMRSAHRYDARRPLLPWLSRILTNHARKVQRSRRRVPDPRRLQATNGQDPFVAAHGREVAAAVQDALTDLPLGYRQVMVLRLVHELQPAAIAHALGCPPETVKTQLKRGMELLRRQLPKGMGGALVVFATNGRGLAAVRAAVLAQGRALLHTARFVPWSLLGVLAMKQIAARALLLTVLVVLGLWGAQWAWSDDHLSAASARAVPALLQATLSSETLPRAETAQREVVLSAAGQVTFRGRCLDAGNHEPLAGCRATVTRKPTSLDRDATIAFDLGHGAEAEVMTAADGRFELHIGVDEAAQYVVEVASSDRVGRQRSFGPWPEARTTDLGDLDMQRGVALSGTVVDQGGRPVPDVQFALIGVFHERYCPLQERYGWNVRSGADGGFTLPYAVAPGQWWVHWLETSIPVGQQEAELDLKVAPLVQHVTLVLPVADDAQTIRGRVCDTEGNPVVRLDLRALGAGTLGMARTDGHGHFAIHRIGPYDAKAQSPVEITLDNPLAGHELTQVATFAWGDRDVSLAVRPARSLTVRPVDAETGALLTDCEVLCAAILQQEGGEGEQAVVPRCRRLPGGESVLALANRPHFLRVLPRNPDRVPSDVVRWHPDQGDSIEIPLPLALHARVRVVAPDGSAVAGSVIWSLRAVDPSATASLPAVRDLGVTPLDRWYRGGVVDEPLDHGTTDGEGLLTLRVCGQGPTVFAALGPGHVPQAFSLGVPRDLQVTLTVDRAAALRGRFTPEDVVCEYLPTASQREREQQYAPWLGHELKVHANRSAAEQAGDSWQAPVTLEVSRDGTWHREGLPPGTYDLTLEARKPFGFDDGTYVNMVLGSVVLLAGKVTEVERDLGGLRPLRLRGRVYVNGEPWAGHEASLEARLGERFTHASVTTDAEGRFEVATIAGSNRLRLMYRASGNVGYWFAPEEVMVTPGQDVDVVFDVRRVVANVRILEDSGTPAAGLQVVMYTQGQPAGWQSWTTDGDGRIAIDPAPMKPFALIVRSPNAATGIAAKLPGAGKDAQLGPFVVPATGKDAAFEARLPEGWR